MTPQPQSQSMPLCPHLAAAALWITKTPLTIRRGKVRQASWYRCASDDLAAL